MTPASHRSFPEIFPRLNFCTTFEHTEQARLGLTVVEGKKGWACLGNFPISYSKTVSESPVLRQRGAIVVNPQREIDGRSLYTCHCRNALVGAAVETQGSQADAPGEYLLQPDLRHPPCGNSSHHTSCIHAKQY